MNKLTLALILLLTSIFFIVLIGCNEDSEFTVQTNGCMGCHGSQDMLKATMDPVDKPPETTGEG